jgi:hypothetical protein
LLLFFARGVSMAETRGFVGRRGVVEGYERVQAMIDDSFADVRASKALERRSLLGRRTGVLNQRGIRRDKQASQRLAFQRGSLLSRSLHP